MDHKESGDLDAFHRGDRGALEACYRDHFDGLFHSLAGMLDPVDRETIIHEVFFRLLTQPEARKGFQGGSMGGWLRTLARNQAIDYLRRLGRSAPLDAIPEASGAEEPLDDRLDLERTVARFREVCPPKWIRVFELRFLRQLDQRSAAKTLGISRTTLAYQEMRVRMLLRRFVLEGDSP
jgi:RNA polymerase sigma-70 factor (ECF subfamily)